jgi:serine phosphatase RsbU (regulator of sigma subunit)
MNCRKTIFYLLFIVYGLSFFVAKGQQHKVDSILNLLKKQGQDTTRVKLLNSLASACSRTSNYIASDSASKEALVLAEKLNYKQGIATAYNGIGIANYNQSNYPEALRNYMLALKLCQELNDKNGVSVLTNDIGMVYDDEGESDKALEYYYKALGQVQKTRDTVDMIKVLNGIAVACDEKQDHEKSLIYYNEALQLCKKNGDNSEIATLTSNMADVYGEQGNFQKALDCQLQSLAMSGKTEDKDGIARTLGNIGESYFNMKKFKEAEQYFLAAKKLSDSIRDIYPLSQAESNLSQLYAITGRWEQAYKTHLYYTRLKDSMFNSDKSQQIGRLEASSEYEKKIALQKAEEDKKDFEVRKEHEKQIVIRNSFIAGFVLMLALAFFIFRGYKQKQKANMIITSQKEEVEKKNRVIEEKNKDIVDSITYAKRLQDAILPPISEIKKHLPDSFVLYKPKDIVAGDFYWMEKLDDVILIAACDCTGHGVPGAMVSVVCSNALNRAVKEFKLRDTGLVLNKVRELVLETFAKSEGEVKDGMDCSFCAIHTNKGIIEWSGAYNPFWYIQEGEMKEIAGDKQPIGKADNPKTFSTHIVTLKKGDLLYLFTDGYADQFGGPKGKKLKYKQLQEKLLAVKHLPMDKQKEELNSTLENWKGSLEQTDDICIIGIRI